MNKNTQSYPLFIKAAFSFKEAIDSTLLTDDESASIGKLPAGMDISRNPDLSKAVDLAEWIKVSKLDPETQKPVKEIAQSETTEEPSAALLLFREMMDMRKLGENFMLLAEHPATTKSEIVFDMADAVGVYLEKIQVGFQSSEPAELVKQLKAEPEFLAHSSEVQEHIVAAILSPNRDEKLKVMGDFFIAMVSEDKADKLAAWMESAQALAEVDTEVAAMLSEVRTAFIGAAMEATTQAFAKTAEKVAPVEVTPVTEVKLEVKVAETEETPANAVPSTSLGQALLNAKNAPRTNQQRSNKPRNK